MKKIGYAIITLLLIVIMIIPFIITTHIKPKKSKVTVAPTATVTTGCATSTPKVLVSLDDLEKMDKEEFTQLDTKFIKYIAENYISDYKKLYKIDKNHKMTDKDWEKIKGLMIYQLYEDTTYIK